MSVRMDTMVFTVCDWRQASEILCPRIDSERATMKPRKFLPESESMKWRMSSGDWIFLEGVWK